MNVKHSKEVHDLLTRLQNMQTESDQTVKRINTENESRRQSMQFRFDELEIRYKDLEKVHAHTRSQLLAAESLLQAKEDVER